MSIVTNHQLSSLNALLPLPLTSLDPQMVHHENASPGIRKKINDCHGYIRLVTKLIIIFIFLSPLLSALHCMEVARPSVYANVLFTRLSDGRGVIKAGRKRKEKEGKKRKKD